MDSRRYMSEGKNVWLSEEVDFPIDNNGCKNNVMGCEVKPIFNLESYPLISNTQALDKLDFMDLGFADDIRKSFSISSEPSGEVFSDEIGTDYLQFGEDRESGPRVSVDFNQSNQKDFSLVDLKLGRLEDGGIVKDSELSKANNVGEPSNMLSPRAKKARLTSTSIRSSCCQVLGCNKDLSSYKSYYRRHKVCDVHTKTPKVIVDGIEQRFCQQCSRFHLLGEFDDIKRSCRRRLSVHNKRRRKPHHSAEPGGGIIDFSSSLAFPSVFLGPSKHEDGFKNSTFLLQMGCVGEKVNSFSANVKDDIVGFAKPMIENLSSIQQTSCALSLLSAQSHSGSNQLLETASMTLINGSSLADLNPGHAFNHSAGYCRKAASCGPHEAGIRLMEADEEGPAMISARNMQTVGLHLSSDSISSRPIIDSHQSKERGIILNLLQLSSNLQRVEQLRHSNENEAG